MSFHSHRLFVTFVLLFLATQICHGQRSLGVNWNLPDDPRQALEELRQMRAMGISVIELQEQPTASIWKELNSLQFKVYGHLPIQFPVSQTFAEPDSLFIRSIEQNASAYLAQPSIQAIALFKYGSVHRSDFREAIGPYIQQLSAAGSEVYFVSSRVLPESQLPADFLIYDVHLSPTNVSSLSVPDSPIIKGYQYSPQKNLQEFLAPLKALVQATTEVPDKTIFLSSEWLFEMIERYPSFEQTLQSLTTGSEAVFPVPNETLPDKQPPVLPILLLVAAWGVIAILYHSSPIYRKSLFRYFLGHKFFIKDIFSRQIRSPIPALTIIFLNAVLMAASSYAAFSMLLTPLGQAGFFYYFPLTLAGPLPESIFLLTLITAIALPLVSILWLFFSHRSLKSLTQIVILYAWPLQLNFITTTVSITLYAANASGYWITFWAFLAMVILLVSYFLASMDAARYIRKKSSLYLALTSGIYMVLISALFIGAISSDTGWQVIDLLLNLR